LPIKEPLSQERADDVWPERIEISDPTAVDLLTNLRVFPALSPFLRDEHTLTSAAAAANRPVSTIAYWVRRLVRCGVLVETRRVARSGMAMPMYRSAARRLVVPIQHLPLDRRVALLDQGRLRVLRRFLDGIDEAMAAHNLGGVRLAAADGPVGVAVDVEEYDERTGLDWTDSWGTVRLSPERALALTREMEDMVAKYAGTDDPVGRRYLLHLGVTPEPRHRWRSADDR